MEPDEIGEVLLREVKGHQNQTGCVKVTR